jgi:hypothetical protein
VGPQTEITAQGLPGDLRMTLSDVRATNIAGPLRIQSTTKDIELIGFTESLDLSVNRGNLILAPGTLRPARMNVRLEAGDVELALAPGAQFELNAETTRGEAINDYGDRVRQEADGRSSRIRGTNGGAPIDISVRRGRMIVRRDGGIVPVPNVQAPRAVAPQAALPAPKAAPPKPVEQ